MTDWPPRFKSAENTPKQWANIIAKMPEHDTRQAMIEQALLDTWKAGYRAGMDHCDGDMLPWEDQAGD